MAKGFGTKPEKQIGYVLVLMPEMNAYAAKFSLDFRGSKEPFIGITNMLGESQVWQNPKQAKRALELYYADFLMEQLQSKSEVRVSIKRLKRSPGGKLQTEEVETLVLSPHKFQN